VQPTRPAPRRTNRAGAVPSRAPRAGGSPASPGLSAFVLLFVGALGLGLSGLGCGGSGAGAALSGASFPVWQGGDRELFGDQIETAAIGLGGGLNPRSDKALWARSTAAELVGRARVQTVTVDTRAGKVHYHLGLRFAEPLLAPSELTERDFELTVEPTDPAYGLVKSLDTALQGRTFVGFLKRFRGADDEIDLHFHLAADSAEVAKVVQEAVALKEFGPK